MLKRYSHTQEQAKKAAIQKLDERISDQGLKDVEIQEVKILG